MAVHLLQPARPKPIYHPSSSDHCNKKPMMMRPTNLLLLLISLLSFALASLLFFTSSFYSTTTTSYSHNAAAAAAAISCDLAAFRTDVCVLRGDVRLHSASASIFLPSHKSDANSSISQTTTIRPYPRKWESSIMSTIQPLRLKPTSTPNPLPCDVRHNATAVVFSTGGYTGNVFHEFNEGIIPLYITSRRFNKDAVFVILDYKSWWVSKYGDILSLLTNLRPIDFFHDSSLTHCFPQAVVGLQIHGDLSIDNRPSPAPSMRDFRQLLDDAYRPRIRSLETEDNFTMASAKRPKAVILSRNGSRAIENERELVRLAEDVGFTVEVLRPDRTTELARIYRALNSSDMMIGVHGAAMTHFLFMRPGSVFLQIVPLGTDWAAHTYYGEPAVKMGLWYLGYKISPAESSLYESYDRDDPVLTDPKGVNARGWEATKRVYLDVQTVRLDLVRFRKQLDRAYWYLVSKRRSYL